MLGPWSLRFGALVQAALFASAALIVEIWAWLLFLEAQARGVQFIGGALVFALMMTPAMCLMIIPAFALGISVVGVPGWMLLHRLNLTQGWPARLAAAFIATLGSAVFAYLLSLSGEPMTWAQQVQGLAYCGFIPAPGLAAAWAIQRVAYDRPKPPRPSLARPS